MSLIEKICFAGFAVFIVACIVYAIILLIQLHKVEKKLKAIDRARQEYYDSFFR